MFHPVTLARHVKYSLFNSGRRPAHQYAQSPVGCRQSAPNVPRETDLSVKTGTVDSGTDSVVNAGDTVTYEFDITNTGDTCLAVTKIIDGNAGEVECPFVVNMAGKNLNYTNVPQPKLRRDSDKFLIG